jgi:hypothetical protein
MKTSTLLSISMGIAMICQTHIGWASEVDDILKEINGDSKKSSSSESSSTSASGGQNTTLKRTSPQSESSASYSSSSSSQPASTPKPRKTVAREYSPPRQQAPQRPSIPVWNPRDKLPKEVTGQGVAGNFVIQGSSSEGTLILIPAEDADNPFARQFWVVNRTFAGGSPNVLVPMGQRQLVQVPANNPLIFIGRGILPGVYNVQAQ